MRIALVLSFAVTAALFVPRALAVESVQAAKDRKAAEAQSALGKGLEFFKANKYDEAISELTKATTDSSILSQENRVVALYARGLAYFNKGDCTAAMADLTPLAEAKASEGEYHYVRFACLEKSGDAAGAVAALDKAIEVAPARADFVRVRCVLRFSARDFKNAIPDCEKVVAANPDDADAWLAIGQSAELTKQNEKALAAYRKILTLKPDNQLAKDGIKRLGG